ncbi:MAG: serine hydrolase domain-containing protein [Saprospiraceae bacterium]
MKKTLYILSLLFLISCSATTVLTPPTALTQETPMAAKEKMPDVAKIDAFIQSYIDEGKLPGGTFYAAHKGKVIYHKSFGNKYVATAYTNNDIYRIASMTKAITTVAIMQLYEQGRLKLDDPLEKYIPAFAEPVVLQKLNQRDSSFTTTPAGKSITLRHLLTHTSGLYYGLFEGGDRFAAYIKSNIEEFGFAAPGLTTSQMANMVAKAPLAHKPGEQWTYGLNMDILGAVVEVISKVELDEYFQKNIFNPIGMKNTAFNIPKSKHAQIVPLYTYDKTGKLKIDESELWMFPALPDEGCYFGGGGLSSTAKDYGLFVQMLLDNGQSNGGQILSRHTVEFMATEQIAHLNKQGKGMTSIPGISFCLGHALVTSDGGGIGPHKPGTYSWGGYFNSKWWVDKEEELVFVGMTNVLPFPYSEFWDRLYPIIYATIE